MLTQGQAAVSVATRRFQFIFPTLPAKGLDMQLHAATGISYDPEIFDEAFIDALMDLPDPDPEDFPDLDDIPGEMPLMTAAPEQPMSPEDVRALMEATWDEMLASEEGEMIRDLSEEEQAALKDQFLTPPDPIGEAAAAALSVPGDRFTLTEDGGNTVLMQGDRPLMTGPLGASANQKKGEFVLAAAMCIADIIAMIIAAVGVLQALNNKTIAKAGANICTKCGGKIVKASGKIAQAAKRGSDLAKAKQMLGVAKGVVGSFGKMAGYLMIDMGKLEKAAAWTTAVGGLTLALATGSSSLWLTVMAMIAAVAMFVADTAVAIKKYNAWKAAS